MRIRHLYDSRRNLEVFLTWPRTSFCPARPSRMTPLNYGLSPLPLLPRPLPKIRDADLQKTNLIFKTLHKNVSSSARQSLHMLPAEQSLPLIRCCVSLYEMDTEGLREEGTLREGSGLPPRSLGPRMSQETCTHQVQQFTHLSSISLSTRVPRGAASQALPHESPEREFLNIL